MRFENFTPHALFLFGADWRGIFHLPPSGQVARVSTKEVLVETNPEGVEFFRQETGEITGLPSPEEGTILVTSLVVRLAVPDRGDVFSPGTIIRDAADNAIGCRGLVGNYPSKGGRSGSSLLPEKSRKSKLQHQHPNPLRTGSAIPWPQHGQTKNLARPPQ